MRVVLLCLLVGAFGLNVTPIQSVIAQLKNILKTVHEDQTKESKQWAVYEQWCGDMENRKQRLISEAHDRIKDNEANIDEAESNIETAQKNIEKFTQMKDFMSGDMKAATSVRAIERGQYEARHRDLMESLNAITGAIKVLKEQDYDYDRPQAEMLLQTAMKGAPGTLKDAVAALMQEAGADDKSDDDNDLDKEYQKQMAVRAPKAHAFEFKSGVVVNMLEKLYKEFDEERENVERRETALQQAFKMLMDKSKMNHERAVNMLKKNSLDLANAQKSKAENTEDHAENTKTKASEEDFKASSSATCAKKKEEFEERKQMRTEEVEAVTKATDILSSQFVAGKETRSSLLQLRTEPMREGEAARYLEKAGLKLNSQSLSALAIRVSAGGPFDKVKKMIEAMIVRLSEQATSETEQKAWCDKELAVNKNDRTEFTDNVNRLKSEIDELTGKINSLNQKIEDQNKNINDMNDDLTKANKNRLDEKDQNEKEIREAKQGQKYIQRAIEVLRDFYSRADKATNFLSVHESPDVPPPIFSKPYKGAQGLKGGVVGMLEVIMSDFERSERETASLETKQEAEFTDFEAKTTKAMQTEKMDKTYAEASLTKAQDRLPKANKEERENSVLLTKAERTFAKLKPPCVKPNVSYEERVKQRAEEIESLGEALSILTGQDAVA